MATWPLLVKTCECCWPNSQRPESSMDNSRFRSSWKATKAMNSVTCSPFAKLASAEVARMSWLRTTTPTPCTMTATASSLLWVAQMFQLATTMQTPPKTMVLANCLRTVSTVMATACSTSTALVSAAVTPRKTPWACVVVTVPPMQMRTASVTTSTTVWVNSTLAAFAMAQAPFTNADVQTSLKVLVTATATCSTSAECAAVTASLKAHATATET